MKNTAMIPYNDSFNDYLDMLINDEQSKPDEIRDREKIEKMQENKLVYSQQIESLKVAMTRSDTRVEIAAENIFEAKAQLMRLKYYGQNLHSMLGKIIRLNSVHLNNLCLTKLTNNIISPLNPFADGIQIGRSVHTQRQRVTVRRRSGSQEDSRTWWNRKWVKFRQYFLKV